MTPDEAYEEALRRIREAEETGAVKLDLSGIKDWKNWKTAVPEFTELAVLTWLPPELARLTSLQSLNLSHCYWLSDMSPLASLTNLQALNLSFCGQLSGDLSPLASLTSLQWLDLNGCIELRKFTPLEPLLPQLQELRLFNCRFDDLPSEVCGQDLSDNVIREVRAHFADLRSGRSIDARIKNFHPG